MAALDRESTTTIGSDEWDGPWDDGPPWFTPPVPISADEPDVALLEALDRVVGGLKPRSADVLRRRLGQSPEGRETLKGIGDSYGVTPERIRQIQQGSVGTIQRAAKRRGTGDVGARLTLVFRSLHRVERGRYLRTTFPDATTEVLSQVLGTLGPARSGDIVRWIKASEEFERRTEAAERQRFREEERWSAFVRGATWPDAASSGGWIPKAPCRPVRVDGGKRWSEKLGRDVQFDSGLEERLVVLFEESGTVVHYCEQPVRIDYPWFDGHRVYVPDFVIRLDDGRSILVEGKPPTDWADAVNVAKWNAATRWCEQRGWGFVVSDGRRSPVDLLGAADERAGADLERLTSNGPATWGDVRRHWFRHGRSWKTLIATSLTYGFVLRRAPFEVWRAPKSPWIDALGRTSRSRPT